MMPDNQSPAPTGRRNHFFLPGVTFLSLSTILLGLMVVGFMIQIGDVQAGASFMIGGLFSLPLRPIMFIVPVILISGLVFYLKKKSLYTRAEMICVLFALLVAPPIMTEGFWHLAVGAICTIPQTSDMAKLDAYSDKMWPHGQNILQRTASQRELHNEKPEDVSSIRVRVPVFQDGKLNLLLDEPYLMTVLARAEHLESESYYYCRIYYDDAAQSATEVFSSREAAQPSARHPSGFIRKGSYGVKFAPTVEREVAIELGLVGRGTVTLADLSLMNVSVIEELTDGRKFASRDEYDQLPEKLRGRVVVKPDSMFSLDGLKLIVTGCIPLREWWNPSLFWFGYIALLLLGTFVLAIIMRKQWLENERYPIPVAQIPIRLLGLDSTDESELGTSKLPAIWKNRVMWIGFGVTFFWCVMKIWAAYNSNVPNLSINVPLNPYFNDPSWGAMWGSVNFKVCSIFLGLAIFMELNVLMTLVLGFFLYRAQYWFGHAYGLESAAGYPFYAEQVNASYLMYALLVIVFTRKYLWKILQRAWQGGRQADEEQEVMSYRSCLVTLLACYAGVIIWAAWAGVGVAGMLVFYTIMLLISFVAAKLRAECGVPFSTYFPWSVLMLVPLLGGSSLFLPSGFLFICIVSELLVIRPFLLIPGIQVEMIELGRRAQVVPRHLLYICLLGVLGAWLVGGWFVLSNAYTTGGSAPAQKTWWFRHYGGFVKQADQAAATHPDKPDAKGSSKVSPATWATLYGAGTVGVVTVLRQFFAGFWFHPIGLIVGPTWMIQEAWGSLLLAWLIRIAVLKLGGAATVRNQLLPFATGIFLGGTAAYFVYAITVSYLKFFVPGTKSIWWTLWAL